VCAARRLVSLLHCSALPLAAGFRVVAHYLPLREDWAAVVFDLLQIDGEEAPTALAVPSAHVVSKCLWSQTPTGSKPT